MRVRVPGYFITSLFQDRLRRVIIFLAGIFIIMFLLENHAFAQGNLLITPKRIVFDGTARSFDINLANVGSDTATYAISLVQIRMTEAGGFETITEPDSGQLFATRYLRFFPRSVTLSPNEAQVVKVQLVRTNELQAGEYRSHFYFRAVPKAKPLGEEELEKEATTISVKITPIFGITIPVIIRNGESTTRTDISDVSFEMVSDTIPRLSMSFLRSGNMSVYGDITVDHLSPAGVMTRVGIAKGLAVYTPNTRRTFQLSLKKLPEVDYHSGKLILIFSAPSDVKPEKYAEAELQLK